jgi:stage V sporulation protein G
MDNIKLDVRVYPIDEPKGNTFAFASVAIEDLAAIRGIRVVNGKNGLFVTMPQSQDNTGLYHDIAFPINGDLRKAINEAVLAEYTRVASIDPQQRGYENAEPGAVGSRGAEEIKIEVRVFPIAEPKGNTLAFASVSLDDIVAIRGIRVENSEKGRSVSLPQSKDNDGNFHDVAFPLSGDLRREVSRAILAEHKAMTADKKQSLGDRVNEGKQKAAQYAAQPREAVAAKAHAPGLGD